MSIPRYRILHDTSPEGLQNQINALNGYRAVNVGGVTVPPGGFWIVALMEYEGREKDQQGWSQVPIERG